MVVSSIDDLLLCGMVGSAVVLIGAACADADFRNVVFGLVMLPDEDEDDGKEEEEESPSSTNGKANLCSNSSSLLFFLSSSTTLP